MPPGRPPKKSDLVDSLDAGNLEHERLRIILQTLSGEVSVVDACQLLDVSETRFHDLRTQGLQAAASSLAPKPRGRPSKEGEPEQVQKLKEQVMDLEVELQTQRVKTELAESMPHLLKDKPTKKKITKKKRLRLESVSKNATFPDWQYASVQHCHQRTTAEACSARLKNAEPSWLFDAPLSASYVGQSSVAVLLNRYLVNSVSLLLLQRAG